MQTDRFELLFDTYYGRIFRYVRYRVGDLQATEDITSDIFLRVVENYHAYSAEKSAFEVWLFAIARNAVTDHHRQTWRNGSWLAAAVDIESARPSPEDGAIAAERREYLYRALGALREKERRLIALKFSSEMKNTEIAGLLGISASQVGVRLHRTLRKIKKIMERL
ncbi:MAG: sigma-70 family RNA polymerase sigma factor [Gracilibacteraceae bacterium]|nr:sigma-70 family RNA polymerase sigma factor [Gracilibacteraceae bacterium]